MPRGCHAAASAYIRPASSLVFAMVLPPVVLLVGALRWPGRATAGPGLARDARVGVGLVVVVVGALGPRLTVAATFFFGGRLRSVGCWFGGLPRTLRCTQ